MPETRMKVTLLRSFLYALGAAIGIPCLYLFLHAAPPEFRAALAVGAVLAFVTVLIHVWRTWWHGEEEA